MDHLSAKRLVSGIAEECMRRGIRCPDIQNDSGEAVRFGESVAVCEQHAAHAHSSISGSHLDLGDMSVSLRMDKQALRSFLNLKHHVTGNPLVISGDTDRCVRQREQRRQMCLRVRQTEWTVDVGKCLDMGILQTHHCSSQARQIGMNGFSNRVSGHGSHRQTKGSLIRPEADGQFRTEQQQALKRTPRPDLDQVREQQTGDA